jgi:hypothetical protein
VNRPLLGLMTMTDRSYAYLRVKWIHSDLNDPVLLYSELDEERWEVRKVEVFADGHRGFACANESFGGSRLAEAVTPSVAEIAADVQFEPIEISRDEFERVWASRRNDGEPWRRHG